MAVVKERGSTGTVGMAVRAGGFDSGFRGEWLVPINNTTSKDIVIVKEGYDWEEVYKRYPGATIYSTKKAVAQFLVLPVLDCSVREVDRAFIDSVVSERGEGKLGSTGK